MKHKINYLGFLSLLALIAILGLITDNNGLYGFFGFAYYLRYFWVIPDEFFQLNVQKAATFAFMSEMISLVPFMFVCTYIYGAAKAVPTAFGLSFAVTIFVFTIALRFLYKGIIINQNKKLSQPTLKRRFFKKKAAFFSWPGLGKEWC